MNSHFESIIEESLQETLSSGRPAYYSDIKNISVLSREIEPLSPSLIASFLSYCMQWEIDYIRKGSKQIDEKSYIVSKYIHHLLKSKFPFTHLDWSLILDKMTSSIHYDQSPFRWPVNAVFQKILVLQKSESISSTLNDSILSFLESIKLIDPLYFAKERKQAIRLCEEILESAINPEKTREVFFSEDDVVGKALNQLIRSYIPAEQNIIFQLADKSLKCSGSKPSQKFLIESNILIEQLSADKFRSFILEVIGIITSSKEIINERRVLYGSTEFLLQLSTFISDDNIQILKGLIWMSSQLPEDDIKLKLTELAERCYKKIPQKGAAAAALGNACLFTIAYEQNLSGVSFLSRLKAKIKLSVAQSLIAQYISKTANALGISMDEVEDMAVENYDLKNSRREIAIGTVTAILEIGSLSKINLSWVRADGKELKSIPESEKTNHSLEFKKIKELQKQIEQNISTQKNRLEMMYRKNRQLKPEHFFRYYIEHSLMVEMTKTLIWNFHSTNQTQQAIYTQNEWVDCNNKPIQISNCEYVTLWHPATSNPDEVSSWRNFMFDNQIRQSIKQAFREVYIITPAEQTTANYSNRMAAHIIRQHQYVALAKLRGWNAQLIGGWDFGDNDRATINLPEVNLTAEFWNNTLTNNDEQSSSGIYTYLSTDQIRFTDYTTRAVRPLQEIPVVIFSEIMRDVDLFVGVSSIGNDPNWIEGGQRPALNEYWTNFSFGELSTSAHERKDLLQRLIPKLKIASSLELTDRFLVVQGQIRRYKIHLGSTNILMEPNDQYLCIVGDLTKSKQVQDIFLPFEGDHALSLILSKAMLLAKDISITDPTILSQINRTK